MECAGDPTLSMSCSDKLAKWNVMGVQGCLLSSYLYEPLRFDTVTSGVAEESDLSEAVVALQRAGTGTYLAAP